MTIIDQRQRKLFAYGLFFAVVFTMSGGGVVAQSIDTSPAITSEILKSYHKLAHGRKAVLDTGFRGVYPQNALRKDIPGKVMLHCVLKADARLHDCVIVSETPADEGFGNATLNVAQHVSIQPLVVNGATVEEEMIEFPMNWQTRDE